VPLLAPPSRTQPLVHPLQQHFPHGLSQLRLFQHGLEELCAEHLGRKHLVLEHLFKQESEVILGIDPSSLYQALVFEQLVLYHFENPVLIREVGTPALVERSEDFGERSQLLLATTVAPNRVDTVELLGLLRLQFQ